MLAILVEALALTVGLVVFAEIISQDIGDILFGALCSAGAMVISGLALFLVFFVPASFLSSPEYDESSMYEICSITESKSDYQINAIEEDGDIVELTLDRNRVAFSVDSNEDKMVLIVEKAWDSLTYSETSSYKVVLPAASDMAALVEYRNEE